MTARPALRNLFTGSFVPLLLLILSLWSIHPSTASGQTAQTTPLTTAALPLLGIIQPGDGNLYSVYQGDPNACYGASATQCGAIYEIETDVKTAFVDTFFYSPNKGGTLGNFPGNLLEGPEGYLFETNGYGGSSAGSTRNGCSQSAYGCGTFFEFFFDSSIERGSHGYDSVYVLHNFTVAADKAV
jgi:hypothetical protein